MTDTTQVNPTLYKMDSGGKIRRWEIAVGEDNIGPFYEQTHGLDNGLLQTTRTHVTSGKNIGRSNETSAAEQCQMEAESLWKKKQDRKGYSVEVPEDKPKLPMLAKTYDKDGKKIEFPAYAQPKLDGIRCFVEIHPPGGTSPSGGVVLKTRTGKIINSLPHINKAAWKLYEALCDANPERWEAAPYSIEPFILDGELYNHVYRDDFQDLVSLIKRDKPNEKSKFAQFHCYDVCCEFTDFGDRVHWLEEIGCCASDIREIKVVRTIVVCDDEDFKRRYSDFMKLGYEGAMIRNRLGEYQFNRRSPDLQKYKSFMDDEFEIVGAYQSIGKQANQCTFMCVTERGTKFGVKPMGDEAQREKYWTDFQAGKLTGKKLTVRFFDWTTSENPVPRFPIGVAIRENY